MLQHLHCFVTKLVRVAACMCVQVAQCAPFRSCYGASEQQSLLNPWLQSRAEINNFLYVAAILGLTLLLHLRVLGCWAQTALINWRHFQRTSTIPTLRERNNRKWGKNPIYLLGGYGLDLA